MSRETRRSPQWRLVESARAIADRLERSSTSSLQHTGAGMPDRPRYDGYLSESSFNEFESPDITAWKLARAAVEHENALVNHRITWLLQSQAFLFSAFFLVFLSWSRGDVYGAALTVIPGLLAVIALFGIYVCIVIQRGIARANEALSDVTVHYKALAEKNGKRLVVH